MMTAITRREFVKIAGTEAIVAGMVAGGVVPLNANPLGLPIGSQTWPHRAMIKAGNFAGLLETLKGIGVQSIELCSAIDYEDLASLSDGKQVRKLIADHGLTCDSAHFGMDELRKRQSESIAWAHDVGITQMVTATLGAGDTPTLDDVKRAADEYNKIAATAKGAGIQQGLHNEGFEVSQVNGKRTYDLLFELLDPALVKFQFQMSTIGLGFVAADYFTKYPGRFNSMHVQDVDLNAKRPATGGDDDDQGRGVQVPVGKGSIDWVKTFQAARTGGVKSYYVEQNMEFTKQSVAFLKNLKV
jgi:sugar phosphate isomerase/epimerase